MFLDELEPGATFNLTPAALQMEVERLTSAQDPLRARGLSVGPYVVLKPQYEAPNGGCSTVEVGGCGGWFRPSNMVRYEVIPVHVPLASSRSYLPSREWMTTSADPEVFLEQNGQIVPGFAVLPEKKTPGYAHEGSGLYHEDGFQAEFSPAPWACHETLAYSIAHVIRDMVYHVNGPLYGKSDPKTIKISNANFVELPPELLATGTDAQVALGCDRSENVWGVSPFVPSSAREFPYRMAGGHIHFGTEHSAKWFHKHAERIIKAMDVFLGVPSVALFAGLDDPRRRQYYGRAGEFRFQKHGLEYRTLSNAWLQHPALMHLTFNLARGAFRLGTSDWEPEFKYDAGLVQHIINDYDVPAAKKFVEDNAKILIWLLNKDSGYGWGAKGLTTIYQGAKDTFGSQLDIQRTWINNVSDPDKFHEYVSYHRIPAWEVSYNETPPSGGVPNEYLPATGRAALEALDRNSAIVGDDTRQPPVPTIRIRPQPTIRAEHFQTPLEQLMQATAPIPSAASWLPSEPIYSFTRPSAAEISAAMAAIPEAPPSNDRFYVYTAGSANAMAIAWEDAGVVQLDPEASTQAQINPQQAQGAVVPRAPERNRRRRG